MDPQIKFDTGPYHPCQVPTNCPPQKLLLCLLGFLSFLSAVAFGAPCACYSSTSAWEVLYSDQLHGG
jgi:hypothetical protein